AIADFRRGQRDAASMMSAIRSNILVVPTPGHDRVFVGHAVGVSWLYAFTSCEQLSRFTLARSWAAAPLPFAWITGARLLDDLLARLPEPCGVALDVAGDAPMLLPPLTGVVPDALALDQRSRRPAQ